MFNGYLTAEEAGEVRARGSVAKTSYKVNSREISNVEE
jgi:hypothetical protein